MSGLYFVSTKNVFTDFAAMLSHVVMLQVASNFV